MKSQQDFCCFNEESHLTRSCSDQSCPHLALPLILSHLAPPYLTTYSVFKFLIMPYHIKMCLVLWQLIIWYGYLAHLNQLLFSFPVLFCLVQSLSCPALFNHCLVPPCSIITLFDLIASQKLSLQERELLLWCQITCSETSSRHQYNLVEAPVH